MGGTHTLWLTAIDKRVKAARGRVGCANRGSVLESPHALPLRQHGGGVRRSRRRDRARLVAPRPLLVIYPDLEAPLSDEGSMLLSEEKLDFMDKAAKVEVLSYGWADGRHLSVRQSGL